MTIFVAIRKPDPKFIILHFYTFPKLDKININFIGSVDPSQLTPGLKISTNSFFFGNTLSLLFQKRRK
jgi:hypothetical protein